MSLEPLYEAVLAAHDEKFFSRLAALHHKLLLPFFPKYIADPADSCNPQDLNAAFKRYFPIGELTKIDLDRGKINGRKRCEV